MFQIKHGFQKYKSVLGSSDTNQAGNQPETEQSSAKPAEDEKAKKQAIAAKMRAQALAKVWFCIEHLGMKF